MKILAVGDFHGKAPKGLKSFLKENPVDVIICDGDLADTNKIRDMYFKNWDKLMNGKSLDKLFESKEDYINTYTKAIESMKTPINFMGESGKKTFLIYGNGDFPRKLTQKLKYKKYGSLENYVSEFGNITLMYRKHVPLGDYNLIGFSGYRSYSTKKGGKNKEFSESFGKNLGKLLSKYRKNTILVTHDAPYNTKMDKVMYIESPAYREHVGDEIIRDAVERYQPLLHICGHIHESQGKEKIGRTLVVNPGYAREGEFALIDLNGKIGVKFYKLNQ